MTSDSSARVISLLFDVLIIELCYIIISLDKWTLFIQELCKSHFMDHPIEESYMDLLAHRSDSKGYPWTEGALPVNQGLSPTIPHWKHIITIQFMWFIMHETMIPVRKWGFCVPVEWVKEHFLGGNSTFLHPALDWGLSIECVMSVSVKKIAVSGHKPEVVWVYVSDVWTPRLYWRSLHHSTDSVLSPHPISETVVL